METKIIACPTTAAEVENLAKFAIKNFDANKKVSVVFALKPSNNLALEMYQKVSEQSEIFDLFVGSETDSLDKMIIKALEKASGCHVLILRSMQTENWNVLLEMLERKKPNVKVVFLKPNIENKLQLFLTQSADFFAKYLYGVRLFDGSIFAIYFDEELVKLAQTFPGKTNLLIKTNSFFGYEKASIEKPITAFPTKALFDVKKDFIVFLTIFTLFIGCFLTQIFVNIFGQNNLPFNIVFILINFVLLVGSILSFSSYCIRKKVGRLVIN